MITRDNIKKVLEAMGFEQNTAIFSKSYAGTHGSLRVDVKNERIHYADIGITVNRDTTSNFAAPENFVVLECVDRLLSMGYKPEHIELEPEWKLGHTHKGGYADIWLRTYNEFMGKKSDKQSLLIIECKKPDEFEPAWRDTLEDGAQLFSYFQQEQATKFLCLYTADWKDNRTEPAYYLINVQDNKELLESNADALSYRDAKNNKQLFRVWHDTYGCDASQRGLIEHDIQPYHLGKNKFTVRDLVPVSNDEIRKKYNEFATILRQHNVGAKENAFDKLVNLFLAKVVDETNNPDDLHFYWKGAAYDDDFSLQDRLQRLYRDGMERFLNETVTYIENEQIEKAFRWYKSDPDATMKTVMDYFRALKFYSDNDFSFISVHNERLFRQNAVILRKVLQMLQNIKLKSTEDGTNTETNQFLGDLFEGFLTKGVKQSEGQYFTPMPIVRFIVSSLPLEQMVSQSEELPACIDYACGAGHFLTEYAERIKEFAKKHKPEIDIREYYKRIMGVEKEYRLSKVSKVSAFMYGHDETNIVYADALQPHPRLHPGAYDVLVANPPYSVTGFLETLSDADRAEFSLFDTTLNTAKCNAIEAFFMERSAQLLRAGGVAGIVLPVSVLNKSGIYARARKIVLERFDIVALAEFGSGTFGKTGTNTVVLFLRRKETNTPTAEHYRARVNAWFSAGDHAYDIYQDEPLMQAYCDHCGYDIDDYRAFLSHGAISDTLARTEPFAAYQESFDSTGRNAMDGVCYTARNIRNKFRNRSKTKVFKKQSGTIQEEEKRQAFSQFASTIEREKLYVFLLAYTVSSPVVLVKSPAANADIKQFLGYGWSNSKGNEGIQYLHISRQQSSDDEGEDDDTMQQIRGISGIETPLFNPNDLDDPQKINTLIRQNFLGEDIQVPESLANYVSQAKLVDMIDFSRTAFDLEIKTSISLKIETQSKWPLATLGSLTSEKPRYGANVAAMDGNPEKDFRYIRITDISESGELNNDWKTAETVDKKYILKENDLLFARSGATAGKPFLYRTRYGKALYAGYLIRFRFKDDVLPEYVFQYCLAENYRKWVIATRSGTSQPNINAKQYSSFKLPIPPTEVQQQIVAECDIIDDEVAKARKVISDSKTEIKTLFEKASQGANNIIKLSDISIFSLSIGKRVLSNELVENGTYKVVSANVHDDFGRANHSVLSDFSVPSVLWGIDGDWMVNYMEKDIPFAPTDHCGVVRVLDETTILPKYLVYPLLKAGEAERFSRANRASTERVRTLSISVPSIDIQRDVVAAIGKYEEEIAKANQVINEAPSRKQAVLDKYLK